MALVNKTFSDIITFTRASTATFFNSAGVLTSAATNAPRFDYNPSTLAAQGLLIEESRTNSFLQSEDFANAAWTLLSANITSNATTSPAGTATADKLFEDTATAAHGIRPTSDITVVANATYAVSVYVKAAERSKFRAYFIDVAGTNGVYADFDVASGTTSGATNGGSGSGATSSIQNVGNGWYRCVAVGSMGGGITTCRVRFRILNAAGAESYTGDGVSGLFLWGAQLEAGAFPTSYIPTTTTALTRAADVASVNTLSPWYNASAGTLYAEAQTFSTSTTAALASIDDTTVSNRIQLRRSASALPSGESRYRMASSGGGFDVLQISGTVAGINKLSIAATAGAQTASTNGATVTGISSITPMPTVTRLALGDGPGSTPLNGWLRRVTFYPRVLSQSEQNAITA